MGIMCIRIFGDVDLIIQQVNNTFQMKNVRLKAYRDEVWKLRYPFLFFELSYIPRALNHLADSLAIFASLFVPPLPPKLNYDVQVKYRPSLLDNVKFWKVFENDDELSKFLQLVDEFSHIHIDQENLNMEESKQLKLKDKVADQNIVQLPSNYIPRVLVPLEELFDHNDIPFKPIKKEQNPTVQEKNIGSQSHPKLINLSTKLTTN